MRTASSVLGLALVLGACTAPTLPERPGRDLMILVSNRSNAELDLTYLSESATSSSAGEATVAGCTSALLSFGGAQDRVTISVNDKPVVDVAVPAGSNGYFVVPLFVAGDGAVSTAAPALRPDPPVEPPAPQGCGE